MDPVDFISLALRLANSQSEADPRTGISRAYYGAFHAARRFLVDCGLHFHRKETYAAEIHRKVRYCLSEGGIADAAKASANLRLLRSQRNAADYDIDSTEFDATIPTVLGLVRIAPEIVDAIQRFRVEPAFTEVRTKIRAYARDVLRITVEGA